MLVVSGTFCSPTTKLLGHKFDMTKDDIVYPSLHPEAAARRVRRTVGNSTANFQEVLKNLGKLIMSNDRQTCVYVAYTCFSNLFLKVNRGRRSD